MDTTNTSGMDYIIPNLILTKSLHVSLVTELLGLILMKSKGEKDTLGHYT